MSEQTFSYRVIRGVIRKPRGDSKRVFTTQGDFFNQGELIPDGIFDEADIASWLEGGRIEPAQVSAEMAQEVIEKIRTRGKFRVDPSSLVGKTMEELLIMVHEIAPEIDANSIEDQRMAVALLTSDWDPKHADTIAPVSDKSRPEALRAHDLEQTENEPATRSDPGPAPSKEAQAALASARERAAAPESK